MKTSGPKPFLLLFLLLFLKQVLLPVQAQYCSFTDYKQAPRIAAPPAGKWSKETDAIAYIPLQFHIIYGSGPDGANWFQADTTLIDRHIDTVNTQFRAAGIQFCKAGLDMIYNDTFCNIDHFSLYYRFRDEYKDTSVIHVFVPCSFGSGSMTLGYSFRGAGGKYDYAGPGPAIAMVSWLKPNSMGADKYVMTHELGHYFGLLHTNHYSYNGDEYADGSNCDTTGDYCCGTPAEYTSFFSDTNCLVIRSLSIPDAHGDTLMPDPRNIMSDNVWSMNCREYFSPDQSDRIKYYRKTYLHYLHCAGTTSIAPDNDNSTEAGISIVPNPASGWQSIELQTLRPGPVRISLHDMTGKLLKQVFHAEVAAGRTLIGSDISELAPGMYLYRIDLGEGSRFRKIVRQ